MLPEKKPAIPDCMKSCPLALVCSTVIVGNLSAAIGLPTIHAMPVSFLRLYVANSPRRSSNRRQGRRAPDSHSFAAPA